MGAGAAAAPARLYNDYQPVTLKAQVGM